MYLVTIDEDGDSHVPLLVFTEESFAMQYCQEWAAEYVNDMDEKAHVEERTNGIHIEDETGVVLIDYSIRPAQLIKGEEWA